jgi:glutamyl-tRNA synthetase
MTNDRPVRVRFAPSPTGMLHIGGARTALFNWAFARSTGGKFILRIEDTDTERNSDESLQSILESMKWLGLDWDEGPQAEGDFGPYHQSQRVDMYQAAIDKGMAEGWLYRCFATATELEAQREEARSNKVNWQHDARWRELSADDSQTKADAGDSFVIRFRVPAGERVLVKDHIRGEVKFASDEVEDWVAVRSNGMPTYNFVCAIDDAAMEISHVIRGEEHLVNTPKQVMLCQALGMPVPDFAHVPLILGADGKKLSKRTGDTALGDYIKSGHPDDALFNFLCLLGFAIDDKTTVFSRDELLKSFELKKISKGGALFDTDKLNWICGEYIRNTSVADLCAAVEPFMVAAGYSLAPELLAKLVTALQPRANLYSHFAEQAAGLVSEVTYDEKAKKELSKEGVLQYLELVAAQLQDGEWPPADFFSLVKQIASDNEVGIGKIMKPLRCALTGALGGPELADVLNILGREQSLSRLAKAGQLV